MLVLLVLMVSSVSANIIGDPPEEDIVPTDQISLNHAIIFPPPFPNSAPGDGVSADEGIASPILFRHGSVIIEGTDGDEKPPPIPK